jgi:hypothetical protein
MGFSIIGASGSGELRKSLRLGGAKRRDLDWYIPETGVVGAQRMIREAIAIAAPAHEAALVAREQAVIEEERTSLMRALASAKADAVAGPTGHEVRVIHHDPVDGEGNLASEGGYLSAWDETVPVPAWAAQADRDERVQQLQNALDKLPSK